MLNTRAALGLIDKTCHVKWQNILVNINKVTSYRLSLNEKCYEYRNRQIDVGINTQHLASETEYFKYYE